MVERRIHPDTIREPAGTPLISELIKESRIAEVSTDRLERIHARQEALSAGMMFWALPEEDRGQAAQILAVDAEEAPPEVRQHPPLLRAREILIEAYTLREALLARNIQPTESSDTVS